MAKVDDPSARPHAGSVGIAGSSGIAGSAATAGTTSDAERGLPRSGSRPVRAQHVLIVHHTERLSPHLMRVHLGGPGFVPFIAGADASKLALTDKYVKLLLPRPGVELHPPYDLSALRDQVPAADMPVRRTYTVSSINTAAQTLAIDFVIHGDEGIAGPWAASARPGDSIALSGPGGMYSPTSAPGVSHLLLGDDSALPAIAAALAALAPVAHGLAVIEVNSAADELPLSAPGGVEIRWIHRTTGGVTREPGVPLAEAVRALSPLVGAVEVFAHGERASMKAIRSTLQEVWGLDRAVLSISAYWALGRAEDRFQAEKREPVGAIFAE